MRLLHKHSLYILLANLLILILGGILFYYLFNFILDRNIRATLYQRKAFASQKLALSDSLYVFQHFSANIFSINRLSTPYSADEQIKDTTIFDPLEDRKSLFRQLTFYETIRGQPFQITVRRPLIDDREIVSGILASLLLLVLVLGVALYFSNRLVSKKLWKPFYTTLVQLRHYQLDERLNTHFPDSQITEFRELNTALQKLIERIHTHYQELKEYTENTTHEIQTPLAIIQSKLELLLEYPLPAEQLKLVHAANQAVSRLARLKEALSLLVRIKNNQYNSVESLSLAKLLESRLTYFEELMEMKGIELQKSIEKKEMLLINPVLGEILLDNLISNAIKYNIQGGTIAVELRPGKLTISNTGETPKIPTTDFFNRFVKSDPGSKSLGLGLAIVKAICEINRLQAEYVFTGGLHRVSILLYHP